MGCGESRIVPGLDGLRYAPYTSDMKQLKNSFKKPGSIRKSTNVRFAIDSEIYGKDDKESENQQSVDSDTSSNAIKEEEEVNKSEENKVEQKKLDFEKISTKCIEIEENKTASKDQKLTHDSHPPQLQEDSQVVSLNSLPIKSRKSEELKIVREKLENSISEIIQKEEEILKLKAENDRLKKVGHNSKETVAGKRHRSSISSMRDLDGKPVMMRDKIKEIKMRTQLSGRLDRPKSIGNRSSSKQLKESSHVWTAIPDTLEETTKTNEVLCDEPLSFEVSLEEAKRRRATQTEDERVKAADTEWEISEVMLL